MAATTQQVIAGLYVAFFNRAPDKEGLAFWESRAATGNELAVYSELAAGFAGHPKFTELYDSLGNQQFVENIYRNVLGFDGDTAGINFWTKTINDGVSRSDMVANFVSSALNTDLSAPEWDSLTALEKTTAQNRQDTLFNKVSAGLDFVDTFGDATNITLPNDLDNDGAYLASVAVLAGVDNTADSVTAAKGILVVDGNGILVVGISAVPETPTESYVLKDTTAESVADANNYLSSGDVTLVVDLDNSNSRSLYGDFTGFSLLSFGEGDVLKVARDDGVITAAEGNGELGGVRAILGSNIQKYYSFNNFEFF